VADRSGSGEIGRDLALSVSSLRLPASLLDLLSRGDSIFAREGQFWDFKRDLPGDDALQLAEVCKDIAGFFNAYGGFLVFGVQEIEKDLRFSVAGIAEAAFPMQRLKGLLTKYLSVVPDIVYEEHVLAAGPSGPVRIASIAVPKRGRSVTPAKFLANGPEKKGKMIFSADQLAVRRGDQTRIVNGLEDWQLVSSERMLEGVWVEMGHLATPTFGTRVLSHNLPTRSAICRRFVGRRDMLASLWSWLNDDFQYCRVVAGDGGKGKTSLAYEFCTQVTQIAPCGFTRIVWLTAKKRQFHAESNDWREMHETHFSSFRSLLEAVGENLGMIPVDIADMSDQQLNRSVRSFIDVQPTLFVFDDLDSLTPDDQKRTLEFASQVGKPAVRFLLTTRSNASYSSDLCLLIRGLDEPDFFQLVEVLLDRYGLEIPDGSKRQLHAATGGSPLLTDSIFRLIKRGTPVGKAIKDWAGASGEDARKAVLQKEIDQLSPEARRVLLCIAMFGQCSRAEVQTVTNLPDSKLDSSLIELESLFLVEAPKIIQSQPRYAMSSITAMIVLGQKEQFAFDCGKIEKRIKEIKSGAANGISKSVRQKVGTAVSQAIALARQGSHPEAIETVNVALRSSNGNPDLLLLRGRLWMNSNPPSLDFARRDFAASHAAGCRKPLLFDLWLQAERRAGYGQGIIDVCTLAAEAAPEDRAIWSERKAEGFVLAGLVRDKSGDVSGAVEELASAAGEMRFALDSGEASESGEELLTLIHDRILNYLPRVSDHGMRISVVDDILKRGDRRPAVFERAFEDLRSLLSSVVGRSTASREWALGQAKFFAAEIAKIPGWPDRYGAIRGKLLAVEDAAKIAG
jgi:hypothetical protein